MRLAVCSAAAPELDLADLLDAMGRRGMDGVELVCGEGRHGLWTGSPQTDLVAARRAASNAGVRIIGLRSGSAEEAASCQAARFAAFLGMAVVVDGRGFDAASLEQAADCYAAAGARLVLGFGSDLQEAERLRALAEATPAATVGLGWEVRPGADDPGSAAALLAAVGPRLAYVRLHGGGPESAGQTGQGIGALMARLTLTRYGGPLVLTPSTPRYHEVWRRWLLGGGGWGCGSKTADPDLVQIGA
jgi:sugar phosphate isomerase/epimerase